MTREEAIKVLKEIKITLETYNAWSKTQSFSEYPQALEKAIFALSAETERIPVSEPKAIANNCDLISRADALNELNGVCSNWQDDSKVAEIIMALQSAELTNLKQEFGSADRPSGEWIEKDKYHLDNVFEIECSQCGSGMWQARNEKKYPNFCYNCGARMENTK